jgi:WD repeat-containing protein 35
VHLESLPTLSQEQRAAYADLALSIFLEHPPVDPHNLREAITRDKRAAGGSRGRELLLEELGDDPDQVRAGLCER